MKKSTKKRIPAGREYLERVAYEWSALEWGKHHPRLVESIAEMLEENARLRVEKNHLLEYIRDKYAEIDRAIAKNVTDDSISLAQFTQDIGYLNALMDIMRVMNSGGR